MDLTQLILDIAKQGPLVGLLLYLMVQKQKKIDAKEVVIENLHKEIRDMQGKFFDRLETIKKDSESVLLAIKEALK